MSFHTGKANQSSIQTMLYPEKKPNMNFHHHKLNLQLLNAIQENNKNQQAMQKENEEKEKNEKQYKLKQFENIPSRLQEDSKKWVEKEVAKRKTSKNKAPASSKINKKETANIQLPQAASNNMFDGYYKNKINDYKEKGYMPNLYSDQPQLSANNNNLDDLDYEKLLLEKLELEKQLQEIEKKEKIDENINNNLEMIPENPNEVKENVMILNNQKAETKKEKQKIKSPVPKRDDQGLILPKIERNYLKENINKVTQAKKKPLTKEEEKKHKNYGKVPEYIKKYEMEGKLKKELEKEEKMKKNLPPGTRLLTEQERLETLNGLIRSKKELETLLEKMPITTRTLAMQQKKQEIYDKLADVEKGIDQFSRQKVYVRIDQFN